MQRLTLDVIIDVVFGITDRARVDDLRRLLPPFVESSRLLIFWGAVMHRDIGPIHPHATFVARRDAVDALLYAEIAERRRATDLGDRSDILSMLVEAAHEDGTPMGDAEIRDELMTLVAAGHETTATALTWAMDLLLRHPDVLARVAADDGGDGAYVDAVCQEVLRIRPVVPIVGRVVTEPVAIGPYELPAGTGLIASILLAHHREDVFPEPEAFRPERFLTDGEVPSYGWLPFGGGVRRCIGASFAQFELATILRVLARSGVRLADPRPEPMRATGVTLVPGRGVPLVR
jgi:cytochrome P450